MKRISNLILLAVATLMMSATLAPRANASLLLEPYAGYYTGKWTVSSSDTNQSGVVYGGRLGIQHLGLMGGIDYMAGNWTDKSTTSITSKPGDLGIFVGYNFPILFRAYATYAFSAKRDWSNASGSDTLKGSEIKLGVGYTGLPFVSINLEYLASTFTTHNGGSLTHDITENMYGLTVSLPLVF